MPIPSPNYDYKTREIANVYRQAIKDVQNELNALQPHEIHKKTHSKAALKNVSNRLKELDEESLVWLQRNVPEFAEDGVERSLLELGVAKTVDEAKEIAKFNRANQAMVEAIIADTHEDLLVVTENMNRKVKRSIRQAASKAQRANYAKGVTGRRTLTADVTKEIRKVLNEATNRGIIDSAGRRWRPDVYSEMLVRTKAQQAHVEATRNEAVQRGALYGIISSHSAIDPCRFHEGRIIKLDPNAPGDYPTYEELQATGQIFHPNCRHVVSPFRKVENLPEEVQNKAEEQKETGEKAVATGKRYPEVDGVKPER